RGRAPSLGALPAAFDLEFLHGVGECKGHVCAREVIAMVGSVEAVVCSKGRLPADAYRIQIEKPCRADRRETHRRRGQWNQVRHVASVERQFDNALVLDDRSDGRSPGFDQSRIGFNLDLLGDLSYLENRI